MKPARLATNHTPHRRSSEDEPINHRHFRAALVWAAMCFILCANVRSALAGSSPFLGEVETFASTSARRAGRPSMASYCRSIRTKPSLHCWERLTAVMDRPLLLCRRPSQSSRRPARCCCSASPCRGSSRPGTKLLRRSFHRTSIHGPVNRNAGLHHRNPHQRQGATFRHAALKAGRRGDRRRARC